MLLGWFIAGWGVTRREHVGADHEFLQLLLPGGLSRPLLCLEPHGPAPPSRPVCEGVWRLWTLSMCINYYQAS